VKAVLILLAILLIPGGLIALGVGLAHSVNDHKLLQGLVGGFAAGLGLMVAASFVNWLIGKLDKLIGGNLNTPPPSPPT
jgi:Na+-translocating ferredoxin:NAD+ oxidoreductase RnfA subunit